MKKTVVKVRIQFMEKLLGTCAKNKELYKMHILEKKNDESLTAQEQEELNSIKENIEARGWTGFHEDEEEGTFIYDYTIKGFLKYSANVLKTQLGLKNLKKKIEDNVFVQPRRVYFGLGEPDGVLERPLRGQTPMGEIVTLVRSDYVREGTLLDFEIHVLDNKEITPDIIKSIMEYGELKGLGQWRNGGYGAFKVVKFEVA